MVLGYKIREFWGLIKFASGAKFFGFFVNSLQHLISNKCDSFVAEFVIRYEIVHVVDVKLGFVRKVASGASEKRRTDLAKLTDMAERG